ncbi:acyl-CoA N-acyltransferase [Legionella busanensis]|uniref:Acyl-CoA N-acyltransferase n=1 Tax=Legionella busanensis TaxID=190655 RepID=A0A378JM28_9GAMM|nr:class I SAM-dependent methyltransferase [Legionella busanensis]STX51748.1 acyl-CoA N-acyltransferase [Legionella busanensis]
MNQSVNTYLNLCTQVYDLSKPNPPKEAYDFYLSYVKEANGTVLEPMCGSGRFLLPMLADGFTIEGFDASPSMLNALIAKASARKIKPVIWQGLIENLNQPKTYQLIFIPSGSFGLITNWETIKIALTAIYRHLAPDGFFIFETETSAALPKELGLWRGSKWRLDDNKFILLSQLAMLEDDICYSIGKYELIHGHSIMQTEIEEYKIRLYNDATFLLDLLKAVGFKQIQLIKAFDRSQSPSTNDESIIYECRK